MDGEDMIYDNQRIGFDVAKRYYHIEANARGQREDNQRCCGFRFVTTTRATYLKREFVKCNWRSLERLSNSSRGKGPLAHRFWALCWLRRHPSFLVEKVRCPTVSRRTGLLR